MYLEFVVLGVAENVYQEMTMDEMKTNKLTICLMYIFSFFSFTFSYVVSCSFFFFFCDGASGILDRYSHLFRKQRALIVSNETVNPEQSPSVKVE